MSLPERPDLSLHQKYAGQGVDAKALQLLEVDLGLSIPPTYRSFLELIGLNTHAVPEWIGSDWTVRHLHDIQHTARGLVANNPFLQRLPDDAFVLLLHQGYSLLFVHASLGDLSPVFTYAETDEPWATAFTHFADLDVLMTHVAPDTWLDAKRLAATATTS